MKRLVLCCDGTWNSPVNSSVSNIEKITRCVRTGVGGDGVQQMVFSVEGVGSQGYLVDRLLGGAFGYGLTRNVVEGYRHLALNYEPGDEIYVFGFSRGAYTARSVVGMMATVGLLTQDALARDQLCEAERIYRTRDVDARRELASSFRSEHCHERVPVAFLGVFDTVGALGVPGLSRRRSRFHNVVLSSEVECARQALAIDDRRITYEPCLWSVPATMAPRVKQVWFPGAHSDVGGGAPTRALSDAALLWMVGEAIARGLAFDEDRLFVQLRHEDTLRFRFRPGLLFGAINLVKRWRPRPRFRGDRRVLAGVPVPVEHVDAVFLAETADRLWGDGTSDYAHHARNLAWWHDAAGSALAERIEPVPGARTDTRPLVLG
ncbi:DUF2235 domain-containing protein [Cellulosimicrobium arenosum]|uniref:DUF2235 domain-containing protein n=1 Tax=Cellulosimicrobium arenosum TaxID=2708133 RepID=A0A927IZ78_9MICO|nr:DUF2235 domain-containing protein [Cellulosimicrobium arenosum]MBD8078203.1 DUF2235 domain-containing protein [Cellulosimicrobium arenosum]